MTALPAAQTSTGGRERPPHGLAHPGLAWRGRHRLRGQPRVAWRLLQYGQELQTRPLPFALFRVFRGQDASHPPIDPYIPGTSMGQGMARDYSEWYTCDTLPPLTRIFPARRVFVSVPVRSIRAARQYGLGPNAQPTFCQRLVRAGSVESIAAATENAGQNREAGRWLAGSWCGLRVPITAGCRTSAFPGTPQRPI